MPHILTGAALLGIEKIYVNHELVSGDPHVVVFLGEMGTKLYRFFPILADAGELTFSVMYSEEQDDGALRAILGRFRIDVAGATVEQVHSEVTVTLHRPWHDRETVIEHIVGAKFVFVTGDTLKLGLVTDRFGKPNLTWNYENSGRVP